MTRVVAADDDPDILLLVRISLERAGFEVECVADGDAALQALQRAPADLAVLDVSMPRMDGLEVTRRLRADPATAALPILLLTAAVQPAAVEAGAAAGADAHVGKPFSPADLMAAALALVGGQAPGVQR